nr:response regulator [Anaerolineae bacterium]
MTTEAAKVLVVDDSALQTRIVGDALRAAGYQVSAANSGEEALGLATTWQPDAIILDVMMPGMSGYQVCRALRQEKTTAHIPVMMLTTKGGIEAKVAGFEAGADDYLVKPVDTAELLVRLKVLLRRARGAEYAVTRTGQLFAVFSLRGGVGVTSLAVNLAVTLGCTSQRRYDSTQVTPGREPTWAEPTSNWAMQRQRSRNWSRHCGLPPTTWTVASPWRGPMLPQGNTGRRR